MSSLKTWSPRDQPEKELNNILEKKYKEINAAYKMLRKISNVNDAKKIIDEIWLMKSFANSIEMELLRRNINGISEENEAGT